MLRDARAPHFEDELLEIARLRRFRLYTATDLQRSRAFQNTVGTAILDRVWARVANAVAIRLPVGMAIGPVRPIRARLGRRALFHRAEARFDRAHDAFLNDIRRQPVK